MNVIFRGSITRGSLIYDYSGVLTRHTRGIDWKAIVRNAAVVCRPSGALDDDSISDVAARELIQEALKQSIAEAVAARYRAPLLVI